MRAVLMATGFRKNLATLLQLRPSPLLTICDRPIIFYIIEYLASLGIKHFEIIVHYYPELIEKAVGDGKRWGVAIHYHLAKDLQFPFSVLSPISHRWENEMIILGQGDTVPYIQLPYEKPSIPIFLQYQDNSWSEWSILSASDLGNIPSKLKISEIEHYFPKKAHAISKPYLSVRTYLEMISSSQSFMQQSNYTRTYMTASRNIEPEVWISRAVTIHPTVKITPPVYIGENCQINRGVSLGPFAVIENNSLIDEYSTIQDSIVFRKSYIGQTLNLKSCIVDRNTLINLRFGTQFDVKEDFILSEMRTPSLMSGPVGIFERGLGLTLLLLFSPILFIHWLICGIKKESVIFLPATENHWKTFVLYSFNTPQDYYFRKLPQLYNVLRGEVHFVGVRPRSIEEMKMLTSDWKKLYLQTKVGLITITGMNRVPPDSHDEVYASEAYYASQMSFWNDLKLFLKWLYRKVTFTL